MFKPKVVRKQMNCIPGL